MPEAARGLRKLKLPLDLPPTSSNLFVVSAVYLIVRVSGKLSLCICAFLSRGEEKEICCLLSVCSLAALTPLH